MSPPSAESQDAASPSVPPRAKGLRGFLQGPRLADRRGFGFVLVIFVLVLVVFAAAFYAFVSTDKPATTAPVAFDAAYMVGLNGTFNVSSDSNATWTWTGFDVNLSINNVWAVAVPLASSGQNATLLIGPPTHKDVYHVRWVDRDGNGAVSVGDVFWITGDRAGLPALSYVQFDLGWRSGGWTATEFFVTSSSII